MKLSKVFIVAITLTLVFLLVAGCGQSATETQETGKAGETETKQETVKLVVGATPVPHAEILEAAKPLLAEKGIELEIKEFTDYVLPNQALADGELDANYFQHVPYLNDFKEKNNLDLTYTVAVHFEPMGLYSQKIKSLEELTEGAKIAVPNDPTNEARALLLLQDNGLIKLKEGIGLTATVNDIVENPKQLEIIELEAAQIPRSLPDVDAAVINGNYAIDAGLSPAKDAIVSESKDSLAAETYANVVAVRVGDEDREEIKALGEVLTSPEIKKFIEETYQGAVVPVF
ncbi:MetQ/NlpA family ABC transporter substrate-binding protein [Calderihabitans maritimus]|uniref:Lipoprotein n=1 Tax=Calderihabitans maritimus TaxID=1246530 RepID=A0A1Z5HSC4_9FIRM|nr:MetQ/NlpA family ABC transporter substrate-binding protein [Calderihabitans maritimus]GAW92422.1 NLPA lipoprotein [Calderihabitans maritimus]